MLSYAVIAALLVLQATTAPPEIQLLINRVVDEDQSVNETIKIRATNDMVEMETLEIMEHNSTDIGNRTMEEDRPHPRIAVRSVGNEPDAEMDGEGHLVVHLPKSGNSSTEIIVGEGNSTVNQASGGALEVNSQGGW